MGMAFWRKTSRQLTDVLFLTEFNLSVNDILHEKGFQGTIGNILLSSTPKSMPFVIMLNDILKKKDTLTNLEMSLN